MLNTSAVDSLLGQQDRGENCFLELTTDFKLHVVADLDRQLPGTSAPTTSGGKGKGKGKNNNNNKPPANSNIGVFAKGNAVINGITINVELSRQQNLVVDADELLAQSNRSAQVQRAVTWGSVVAAAGRNALCVQVDVAFALLSSTSWSFEDTLGCGLRATLKLAGEVPKRAPQAVASAAAASLTGENAVVIHESMFHGSSKTTADGKVATTIEVAIPPFFLDPTKSLDEAAGTHTLTCSLACGATLTLAIRRDTTKVTRPVSVEPEEILLSVTRGEVIGHVSARKNNTKNSAIAVIELVSSKFAAATTLEDWKPVVVLKGIQANVSVVITPTEPTAADGSDLSASGVEAEENEDVYRSVYDFLHHQEDYGLPTLSMTQVFEFVQHEGQVVHANRVRDATRRYIISARLGSPERPRHTGHRNGGSSATVSHDF